MLSLIRCVQFCLAESVLEAGCLSAVLGTLSAVKTVSGLLLHLVAVFADLQRIVTLLVLLRVFRAHHGTWGNAVLLHARLIVVGPITNSLVLSLAYFNHLFGDNSPGDSLGMTTLTVTLLFLSVLNACLFIFWIALVMRPWLDSMTYKLKVTRALEPTTFIASDRHTSDSNCAICLSEVEIGEVVAQLPCNHCFHEACIRNWLATGGMCPMRCPPPEVPSDNRTACRDTCRALLGVVSQQIEIVVERWLTYARVVRWAATCQWCKRSNTGSRPAQPEAEPRPAQREDMPTNSTQVPDAFQLDREHQISSTRAAQLREASGQLRAVLTSEAGSYREASHAIQEDVNTNSIQVEVSS